MLEEGRAGDALDRSRAIVRGNEGAVLRVVLATSALTIAVGLAFSVAARGSGLFGLWLALTVGSALTAPFTAHALTVVYYMLLEPDRPVALERGRRRRSVGDEQE
jgi:multisubunit Na+/H+ antiporter MnhG subunit